MRKKTLLITLLILTLAGAALFPRQAARANTYLVTNTNNSGPGSLRQAIADANLNTGTDTITFATSTNGIPIILAGTAGDDANASGDLDILDGGDLTILGNGTDNTIIDGGGVDRVFHVCPGGGCTHTVTFSSVTIRNGLSNSAAGGGILNEGALLNIQDSLLGGEGFPNQAVVGGGICNNVGTTVVDRSTISANAAFSGGGIYNTATLIIKNSSTIGGAGVGNQALFGDGGGIYNDTGTMTVDDSTISANTATDNGGGIYNQATLNVQNDSIIGGVSVGNAAGGDGGGIYNETGTMTVDGSTISANTATDNGGGIYNIDNGNITVDDSIVSANTATNGSGGGIVNLATLNVLNGSTISANMATNGYGGGILNLATLDVQNGSRIGGSGAGNAAERGGGIYNGGGTTRVNNSTVSDNSVIKDGGGIYNYAGTLNVYNDSTISANSAYYGGGIYNFETGIVTVDDSTINANSANSGGGGIYNMATLIIQNGSTIGGAGEGNQAWPSGDGGGIYNEAGSIIMDNSTISANTAKVNGGGIYNNQGTLTIQNGSTIGDAGAGNTARNGGGIYNGLSGLGITTVIASRFLNNTATNNGGGVFSDVNTAGGTIVTFSCIVGNSAMSFFNNQPEEQIATDNWWGVPTGPNTPSADTVLGNVDVSDHLTSPILDCAADLQVNKVNDTDGNALAGTPFHWTLTIANTSLISATFDTVETILVDELPTGPTYGSPVAGNFVDVVNSANIHCSLAGNTLTCEPRDGSVTLGPNSGSFEVTFSVTPSAPVSLVNPAGICQVDPDGDVIEGDESNNNCPPNVVNVTLPSTYLPLVLR